MKIRITNEAYTGSASESECMFASIEEAEAALTKLFEEKITLTPGDYEEVDAKRCTCGGVMWLNDDQTFYQCEMCGEIIDCDDPMQTANADEQDRSMKPRDWPDVLLVWSDGTGWDGTAVDPNDHPAAYLDAWLRDTLNSETTGERLMQHLDCWNRVEWNPEMGSYYRPRYERADGTPTQYEANYKPDDLSYLPDMYVIDGDEVIGEKQ